MSISGALCSRISLEAPVLIADVTSMVCVLGGADNAACNIKSLGGKVYLIGVIGNDSSGEKLLWKLKQSIRTSKKES